MMNEQAATEINWRERLSALRRALAVALSDAETAMSADYEMIEIDEDEENPYWVLETEEDRANAVMDELWSELSRILVDHRMPWKCNRDDLDADLASWMVDIVNERRHADGLPRLRLGIARRVPIVGTVTGMGPDGELRVAWDKERGRDGRR